MVTHDASFLSRIWEGPFLPPSQHRPAAAAGKWPTVRRPRSPQGSLPALPWSPHPGGLGWRLAANTFPFPLLTAFPLLGCIYCPGKEIKFPQEAGWMRRWAERAEGEGQKGETKAEWRDLGRDDN